MTKIKADLRDLKTKAREVREMGNVPGVFYGFKKETTPVSVGKMDFVKAFREVGETNTLTLETPSGSFDVLIHDVQHDPITNEPNHVDFLAVDMNKEVEVAVPLEFTGESEAVRGGGVLVKVLHEVEVSGLPKNIPHAITVDISKLVDNDSVITLADLVLPEGVKVMSEPDAVVASIAVAKDEPVESAEAPDFSKIEVEAKGKKEEEGEAESSAEGEK